ncbi:1,4-dihydroxy-2-naphthoate octaprenyltransferase [Arthrobacter silviterrae]|nr:1,4-dihydroxy-2-naphthoate octaprenyltransferase [Arthrobacter silviterrae]
MDMLTLGYIGLGMIVVTVIMSIIAIYGGRHTHVH